MIYVLSINYDYVGQVNDDAWYVNASRYLAGVQKEKKQLQGRPLGYPLLLVPVAKLFPNSLIPLRLCSAMFILGVPFLIFYFLKDIFDPDNLLAYIALFCLNPFIVRLSTSVLSEAPFIFFEVLFIVMLKKYLSYKKENLSLKHIIYLVFPLTFLFYLRSQGAILFVGLFIYLFIKKRYRDLIYITFFYLIFITPILIKGATAGTSLDKYMMEVGKTYSASSVFELIKENFIYYLKNTVFIVVFALNKTSWNSFLFKNFIIIPVSGLIALYTGYKMIIQKNKEYLLPVKIYLLFYFFVQIIWVNVSLRYIVPVFPFVLLFFLKSLSKKKVLFYSLSGVLLVSSVNTDRIIIRDSLKERKNSSRRPFKTFQWIRENTPKDALIMCNFAPRTYLRTRRKTTGMKVLQRDEFYHMVLTKNIDYIAYFSTRHLQRSHQFSAQKTRYTQARYILKDKTRYEVVYENPVEDTAILKPKKIKNFKQAWKLYRQGMERFRKDNLKDAEKKLEQSLKLYNDFPLASSNLASIYIMKKKYSQALELLDSIVKIYPKSGVLWALRGRVYYNLGNIEKAKENWEKALEIAEYLNKHQLKEDILKDLSLTKK
ncbi:MAG: tetratricopeptide repeat protein [Elusimicrobiota bacterium]